MNKKNLMSTQNFEKDEIKNFVVSDDVSTYHEVKESPFTGIKVKGKWRIVMANDIASAKEFDNIDDMEKYIYSKPWELIVTASNIFNKLVEKGGNNE